MWEADRGRLCSGSFGVESSRRSNLLYLDKNTLLFAVGNTVQIMDIETKKIKYLVGFDQGGIGALAVHPSGQFFAVGEKGQGPNIYIYKYPALEVFKVLRQGTERSYADLCFSPSGDKLASVGGAPDYLLTVWDWKMEAVVLRSKAFGQDVFRVTFSPLQEGRLTTSGTGHIRFWKMAETFTGLKLQGDLGKFGKVEISDIAGYAELPDGKVLSGSESGNLILWEGKLIKCEIALKDGSPCHKGGVECVFLEHDAELGIDVFVTGGLDGYAFDAASYPFAFDWTVVRGSLSCRRLLILVICGAPSQAREILGLLSN